jgi:hypothetical protein
MSRSQASGVSYNEYFWEGSRDPRREMAENLGQKLPSESQMRQEEQQRWLASQPPERKLSVRPGVEYIKANTARECKVAGYQRRRGKDKECQRQLSIIQENIQIRNNSERKRGRPKEETRRECDISWELEEQERFLELKPQSFKYPHAGTRYSWISDRMQLSMIDNK